MNLEKHLHTNGTRIVKFFLHLSEEEQRKRFLARIDEPEKNWKFSKADIEERKFRKQYMKAYEQCLGATSTDHSPWYVVPADEETGGPQPVQSCPIAIRGTIGLSPPAIRGVLMCLSTSLISRRSSHFWLAS